MMKTAHTAAAFWLLLLCWLAPSSLLLVDAIKEIPLPHVDIFMLCSKDIDTSGFDYVRALDGFFTDLIPSAVDVTIDAGNQEFVACGADENRTQVMISGDGVAELANNNPLTQSDIKSLVSIQSLNSYFSNACKERDTFEAIISAAGSDPKTGVEAALTHFVCDAESSVVLARSIETAAIVSIVISVVLVLCFLACICACCGLCS
jgi:hypothetical protein